MKSARLLLCCLAVVSIVPGPAATTLADWPQWRGPNRDGHAAPQELLTSWTQTAPKLLWTFDAAGIGYSSQAIAAGNVYTLGSDDQDCFLICVDAQNGKESWRTKFSRSSTADDYLHGWGGGPRSTPTVDGDQIFSLSDVGVLSAISIDGQLQWSVDLVKDFGGEIPKWGYSESPLVDGDRVVVTPGGSNFMVALDRRTGQQVWQSRGINDSAQYVSIIRGEVGGVPYYVTAGGSGLIAAHPETGEELFREGLTGNDVAVIPTPIVLPTQIYHTSNYGAGNLLLSLAASGDDGINAELVYHLQGKSMMNHHGGVVLVDGVIYGFTKADGGVWMAQDLASGDTLWTEKIGRNSSGSIAVADGHLYCYNDKDGTIVLVQPSREGFRSKGTLKLPRETDLPRGQGAIWAHPVIADGKLFIRDQDLLFAFDISAN